MSVETTIRELTHAGEWADFSHLPEQPSIKAEFLRNLLIQLSTSEAGVTPKAAWLGLRVRGIRIEGKLDLASLGNEHSLLAPLALENCFIPDAISLTKTCIKSVSFANSQFRSLDASDCRFSGSLNLKHVSPASTYCTIDLWSCVLHGSLHLDGAKLVAPNDQRAFDASLAVISGSAHLRRDFHARGYVRFHNAEVGKTLDLSGAELSVRSGTALSLERCKIGASLLIRHCTKIIGRFSALGMRVTGNVEMLGIDARNSEGTALNFFDAKVHGSVILGFGGAMLSTALEPQSDSWNVNPNFLGDVLFDRLRCEGTLRLNGVKIERSRKSPDEFGVAVELSLKDAQIDNLSLLNVNCGPASAIDVRFASTRVLEDDLNKGWGSNETALMLDGFRYDRLASPDGNKGTKIAKARVAWLKRDVATRNQPTHQPQPYNQLANALANHGHRGAAKDVRVASSLNQLQRETPWAIKPFVFLYWLLFEFGYSPTRAMSTLLVSVVIGWCAVWWAQSSDVLIVDTLAVASVSSPSGDIGIGVVQNDDMLARTPCGSSIDPLYYALDLFVPLMDFNQVRKCEIDRNVASSNWWRLFFNGYSLMGWMIISLSILTFTGSVSRASVESGEHR